MRDGAELKVDKSIVLLMLLVDFGYLDFLFIDLNLVFRLVCVKTHVLLSIKFQLDEHLRAELFHCDAFLYHESDVVFSQETAPRMRLNDDQHCVLVLSQKFVRQLPPDSPILFRELRCLIFLAHLSLNDYYEFINKSTK